MSKESKAMGGEVYCIIFDGPPEPEAGRFVEVEDANGKSISAGEWSRRADGCWVLTIPRQAAATAQEPDFVRMYAVEPAAPASILAIRRARGGEK